MLSKLIKKYKECKTINSNKPKEICACYKVTSHDVINALNNGCDDIVCIRKNTKAGTACGKCNSYLEYQIYKYKKQASN